MRYNRRSCNNKSSCTHFHIHFLQTKMILKSEIMTSFLDNMSAYDCPWERSVAFLFNETLMTSYLYFKGTGISNLQVKISIWHMTSTQENIMTYHLFSLVYQVNNPNQCFVSCLHVIIDTESMKIHRTYLLNEHCLKSIYRSALKLHLKFRFSLKASRLFPWYKSIL